MKKLLLLCCALLALTGSYLLADFSPDDTFLEAYFFVRGGDDASRDNDTATATAKYTAAIQKLRAIETQAPQWNSNLIQYRLKYCTDRLTSLNAPVPPSGTGVSPVQTAPARVEPPTAPVPAAAQEPEKIRELTSELEKSRNTIHVLQQSRDDLTAKLADLQKKHTAAFDETKETIRALRANNQALTAKLDEAKAQVIQIETLTAELDKTRTEVGKLTASRDELNAKLQDVLAKSAASAQAKTASASQIKELLKENADLTAQLAAAQTKLVNFAARPSSPAAPDTEKIQLRADLVQVRKQLSDLRAENASLKQSHALLASRLKQTERELAAARIANEKSDDLISQLHKENKTLRAAGTSNIKPKSRTKPAAEERTGFLWWSKPKKPTVPPAPEPPAATQSNTNKLVATINAPVTIKPTMNDTRTVPVAKPVPMTESETLLAEARTALAAKDTEAAAAKFEAVLKHDDGNVKALSGLGALRYQQGKVEEAQSLMEKVTAADPNDSQARSLLGVIYLRKGKVEEAFQELTRAKALDPRNAEASNYLGIVLSEKGWNAAAELEVRRALELNPNYAEAHFNLAVLYARGRTPQHELARYHYKKAIELGSDRDPQLETLLKKTAKTEETPKPASP